MCMKNRVLELIINLKKEYKEKTGKEPDYNYGPGESCVARWIKELGDEKYSDLLKFLIINQYGTYVLFHYSKFNEIFSDITPEKFWNMHDGFFRLCRGIVVDVKSEKLILTPYDKFFNIDEFPGWTRKEIEKRIKGAKEVEFSNKLDGSMQSYRVLPGGDLVCAGSLAVDPEVSDRIKKGREFFFSDPAYYNMCADYPEYTFIFEFICPSIDPHVVVYNESQEGIYLTGMRNVETGEVLSYKRTIEIAEKYGVKHTDTYKLTLEDAYASLDKYKSSEAEGLVIAIDGFRAKLKYNDFLKIQKIIHRIVSPNPILEAIITGTYDDIISRVPDGYKERVESIKTDAIKKMSYVEKFFDKCYSDITSHKFSGIPEQMKYIMTTYKETGLSGKLIYYIKTGKHPGLDLFKVLGKRPFRGVELDKLYQKCLENEYKGR